MYYYEILCATGTLLVGIAFFIFASSLNKSALYIPAGILSSTGGIQMYISSSSDYVAWVYLWPLIFVGLGMGFILFDRNKKHPVLSWIGLLWCGMGFAFTAIGYSLYHINANIFNWPMVIIGCGLMFLLPGMPGKLRAFRIPGFLITGLGSILMLQWITQNWQSWTYVWALLPALVGLGIITASKDNNKTFTAGNIVLGISTMLFLIFATVFSGYWYILRYWPIILVILGFWVLFRNNYRKSISMQNWNREKVESSN